MPEHKVDDSKPQAPDPSPRWIDAHCHLADLRVAAHLDRQIAQAREAGIGRWIQGGIDPEDWDRQEALVSRFGDAIVPAFGLHPWWVASHSTEEIDQGLAALETRLPRASALGELGLDALPRHASPESMGRQRRAFELQLELSQRQPKPLILHIVRAHGEALEILSRYQPFPEGGLVHSFGASREVAEAYLDLGFHLSLGGSVTREGFQNLKKAVGSLPLDRLVIETDSPDQTPHLPGVAATGLNELRHLLGIAEAVARLRGIERDDLLEQSSKNLKRLFHL